MVITDYRVQSVLRTYGRQLQRVRTEKPSSQGQSDGSVSVEVVTLSDEVRRKLIMERMTSQVMEKVYPRQEGSAGEEK